MYLCISRWMCSTFRGMWRPPLLLLINLRICSTQHFRKSSLGLRKENVFFEGCFHEIWLARTCRRVWCFYRMKVLLSSQLACFTQLSGACYANVFEVAAKKKKKKWHWNQPVLHTLQYPSSEWISLIALFHESINQRANPSPRCFTFTRRCRRLLHQGLSPSVGCSLGFGVLLKNTWTHGQIWHRTTFRLRLYQPCQSRSLLSLYADRGDEVWHHRDLHYSFSGFRQSVFRRLAT